MVGSAVPTMVWSRAARNIPSMSPLNTIMIWRWVRATTGRRPTGAPAGPLRRPAPSRASSASPFGAASMLIGSPRGSCRSRCRPWPGGCRGGRPRGGAARWPARCAPRRSSRRWPGQDAGVGTPTPPRGRRSPRSVRLSSAARPSAGSGVRGDQAGGHQIADLAADGREIELHRGGHARRGGPAPPRTPAPGASSRSGSRRRPRAGRPGAPRGAGWPGPPGSATARARPRHAHRCRIGVACGGVGGRRGHRGTRSESVDGWVRYCGAPAGTRTVGGGVPLPAI